MTTTTRTEIESWIERITIRLAASEAAIAERRAERRYTDVWELAAAGDMALLEGLRWQLTQIGD